MRAQRAAVALVTAGVVVGMGPGAAVAAPGGGQGANTVHRATDTFIDTVPCATDTGRFRITIRFNSVQKESDQGGHFKQTGRFTAAPVTAAGMPREGETYSGRFTAAGNFRSTEKVTVETYVFRIHGMSSDGERVRAHALFHLTFVDGEEKASIERERCL